MGYLELFAQRTFAKETERITGGARLAVSGSPRAAALGEQRLGDVQLAPQP